MPGAVSRVGGVRLEWPVVPLPGSPLHVHERVPSGLLLSDLVPAGGLPLRDHRRWLRQHAEVPYLPSRANLRERPFLRPGGRRGVHAESMPVVRVWLDRRRLRRTGGVRRLLLELRGGGAVVSVCRGLTRGS